jgi:hypothetical protein
MKTKLLIIELFAGAYTAFHFRYEPVQTEPINSVDTLTIVTNHLLAYQDSSNACFLASNNNMYEYYENQLDSLVDLASCHLTSKDFEIVMERLIDNKGW